MKTAIPTAHTPLHPNITIATPNNPQHAQSIHHLETLCFINPTTNLPNTHPQLATDSPSWSLASVASELANPHSCTLLYTPTNTTTPAGYIVYRTIKIKIKIKMPALNETEILRLGVNPQWQGQGIATALLNEAVRLVTMGNNPCQIRLEVSKHNTTAVRFYNKHGFIVANIRKNYYNNSDALEMVRG